MLVAVLSLNTTRAESFSIALHVGFPTLAAVSASYDLGDFGVRLMLGPAFTGIDALGRVPVLDGFTPYYGLGVGISPIDHYSMNGRRYSLLAWQVVVGFELRFAPSWNAFLEFTPTFLSDIQPSSVPDLTSDLWRSFLILNVNLGVRYRF